MKSYGTRTLVGNWWEERQNLEAYFGEIQTKDMTVDVRISAKKKNPEIVCSENTPMMSTYQQETNPENLEKQKRLIKHVQNVQRRKLLVGTTPSAEAPQESLTTKQLSTRFYDPQKTRYKTVYQKSYNQPEFETIRAMRAASPVKQETFHDAHKTTLDLSWNP